MFISSASQLICTVLQLRGAQQLYVSRGRNASLTQLPGWQGHHLTKTLVVTPPFLEAHPHEAKSRHNGRKLGHLNISEPRPWHRDGGRRKVPCLQMPRLATSGWPGEL